jgi:hypothetical protein
MTNPKNDDAKSVAHYQTLLGAWIDISLERDRTLLTLATAGVGLLVTILTTTGVQSLWMIVLYIGAFAGFLATIIFSFQLYRANASTLKHEITNCDEQRPDLRGLDMRTMRSFSIGVVFSILIGVASGTHSFMGGDLMGRNSSSGDRLKSLDGIEGLRPQPTDEPRPANQPVDTAQPAQEQTQDNESTDESN